VLVVLLTSCYVLCNSLPQLWPSDMHIPIPVQHNCSSNSSCHTTHCLAQHGWRQHLPLLLHATHHSANTTRFMPCSFTADASASTSSLQGRSSSSSRWH
jgi:hypothetical protein